METWIRRVSVLGALVLGLLWALGLSWGCGGPEPTPRPPSATEAPQKPSTKKPAGELHVRVEPGVVVRADAEPGSRAVRVLERAELLRVVEKRGEVYRVAFAGGEGWIREGERVRELRILSTRLPPQASSPADREAIEAARRHLDDGGRRLRCGPYALLTDLRPGDARDRRLLDACERLLSKLDRAYGERYGVEPVGEPGETLILFRDAEAFRAFSRDGGPGTGYAGHARGADGYLALYAGSRPEDVVIQTLVHEATHLVSRRALGAPLPRWLSEGLADGLGDPAGVSGLGPIHGLGGAEAMARRVLELPELPDLERLTALDRDAFDRDPRGRDYEQSAVFVRFLMSHEDRARRFRAYLQGISRGESAGPEALFEHLGEDADTLDDELRGWLVRRPV